MSQPVERGHHHDDAATARLEEAVPDSILLPYQQAWVGDDSQVKVHEKGRRIGISWAEAADAALYAAQRSGSNVYYLAYNQDMTRQFIEDVAWWAQWYDLAAGELEEKEVVYQDDDGEKSVKVFQVSFASGHVVQALPSTPRNLRSKGAPGERAILDEFAFVDAPAELMKAAMAFTVWGGGVHIISTHDGVNNPFNELIEEVRAGKKPYSVHRTTFKEAVSEGLYERICLVTGQEWSPEAEAEWVEDVYAFYGDDASEELDVEPAESEGRYISRLVVRQSMTEKAPVLRLHLDDAWATRPSHERVMHVDEWLRMDVQPVLDEADAHLKSYSGMDFARHGDLSALIVAQQDEQLVLRSLACLELRNVPYEQQRQIVEYVLGRMPRLMHAAFDATGNGGYLAEVAMQRFGSARVSQIKLNNPWYMQWMPRYRSKLEDRRLLLPEHVDILDDHSDVVRQRGVPRVPQGKTRKGSDGEQRHGDTAIAACLLSYASEQEGAPIDYKTDGSRGAGEAYREDEPERDRTTSTGFGGITPSYSIDGYTL